MSKSNTDKKIDALTSAIERLIDSKPIVGQTGATGAAGAVGASGISTSPEDHNLILGLVGKMETVNVKVDALKDDIAELKKDKDIFVTQSQHTELMKVSNDHETRIRTMEDVVADVKTIKKLVYGCAALILTTVVVAIIYLVIKQ
jgi:hypothetical protein